MPCDFWLCGDEPPDVHCDIIPSRLWVSGDDIDEGRSLIRSVLVVEEYRMYEGPYVIEGG